MISFVFLEFELKKWRWIFFEFNDIEWYILRTIIFYILPNTYVRVNYNFYP